ncbi:MAG: leucyl/phenylalanyl-tRNA--protein transferase [Deltaproteobacteria bacterium]|jgi:leucyl/phenylalanyl-tRNA--protein transferase|nr:leucyl/phenylalanyl-tRNA--protein transferase [Deltaproteobacteria bacterium]
MPIFELIEHIIFPSSDEASPSGILAVGGDLSPERILEAYRQGIFPWYTDEEPILWWSPNPRFVLFPSEIHISQTMRQILRQGRFRITYDRDFYGVITACQKPRKGQQGTWITGEMKEAYVALHELGYAHSVEAWQGEVLAGGLYGISLGRCFFGESMFSAVSNASKAALIILGKQLAARGFGLIDCQIYSKHLASLGARNISRQEFADHLQNLLTFETIQGDWGVFLGS